MKILHCIPTLECGGAERQLSYLSPELARRGHEVHVTFLRGGVNLERLCRSHVHLHQLKARSKYDPLLLWQLDRLIRKIRPDIIQTWLINMDILGGLAALSKRMTWVLRESSCARIGHNTFKRNLRQRLGKKAQAIIANSNGGVCYWRMRGYKGKDFLIPNCLPLEEISAEELACLPGMGKYSGENFVLYAGRMLDEEKNVEKLILSLFNINQKIKIKAALCGDGPERVRLAELINKNGYKDRIYLPGIVNNVWGVMKRADVFVSVSHYEGRPNSVLEAMACGCPLVVSDIPAHREFLDERCAVLVDPQNVEAIAQGIRMVLENLESAGARAEVARAKVGAWSIPAIANQYEQVYQDILKC